MIIKKDGKEYAIEERKELWVVSCKIGELSVEYKISKDICENEEQLRAYIAAEKLF